MLCEKCGKQMAVYHSTISINGNVSETHLCQDCAILENKKDTLFNYDSIFNSTLFPFGNKFFNFDKISPVSYLICKNCNTSYDDFLQRGTLGCQHCYDTFSDNLIGVIKDIQHAPLHVGKVPNESNEANDKDKHLSTLQFQLNDAVLHENYELASKLKKEIDKLRGKE